MDIFRDLFLGVEGYLEVWRSVVDVEYDGSLYVTRGGF